MRRIPQGTRVLRWMETAKLESMLVVPGDEEPLATLRWKNSWGSLAAGESSDGSWTFKRSGFLRPRVTARETGSGQAVCEVAMHAGGDGSMQVMGRSYSFERAGFWHPVWRVCKSPHGEPILTIGYDHGQEKGDNSTIELGQAGDIPSPDISLISILAWYLLLLIQYSDYESSGAVAAVTAAVA